MFTQSENYVWPFEGNLEADVAPRENEYDTPAPRTGFFKNVFWGKKSRNLVNEMSLTFKLNLYRRHHGHILQVSECLPVHPSENSHLAAECPPGEQPHWGPQVGMCLQNHSQGHEAASLPFSPGTCSELAYVGPQLVTCCVSHGAGGSALRACRWGRLVLLHRRSLRAVAQTHWGRAPAGRGCLGPGRADWPAHWGKTQESEPTSLPLALP